MKKIKFIFFICIFSVTLWACGVQRVSDVKEIDELIYLRSMKLEYATEFSVDYYEGGYKIIKIVGDQNYLIVPEDKNVPKNLKDITVLKQPLNNIYLVSSSAMDLFTKIDGMDYIGLTGTKEEEWYIDEAREKMDKGEIVYAGKYSAPDYEMILASDCGLAIENTMIYHTPEVKEKLEELGIPVLVEHSSMEAHPLGRMEWIKLYGAILNKDDKAEEFFDTQVKAVKEMEELSHGNSINKGDGDDTNNKPVVAYFYVTSTGTVNVRKSGDYISKMIEMAGGQYLFSDLTDDNALSTVNIQMEEFIEKAQDCDYLIYNSTIDGELKNLQELLIKCPELKNSKAVLNGNVYCTGKNMFQETTGIGTMILDIHYMLNSNDWMFSYLYKLED